AARAGRHPDARIPTRPPAAPLDDRAAHMTGGALETARIVGGPVLTFPGGASPVKIAPRRRPDGCDRVPPPPGASRTGPQRACAGRGDSTACISRDAVDERLGRSACRPARPPGRRPAGPDRQPGTAKSVEPRTGSYASVASGVGPFESPGRVALLSPEI